MSVLETDLSEPIMAWLEECGCVVKCEVKDIDVLGMLPNEALIAVELKKTLNLEVINQAVQRQRIADFVYIAVIHDSKSMKTKRVQRTLYTLKRLNIGFVTVDLKKKPTVKKHFDPDALDFFKSRSSSIAKKKTLIKEFKERSNNLNKGGSTRTKVMTAYRETCICIACHLKENGRMSPKNLVALGMDRVKVASILNKNFYGWYQRVDRGVYELSETGQQYLKKHEDMISLLNTKEHYE